ncbi:uncharacterized protein AC631_02312 [Debaryomyces fabryi]|uniref:Uncharacterized protein n=1 Tax=Debaryomyces fabryi TaxID=58627 RepID=A0A0V1Q086_9ASCO|nr:uncharacterized protein AC631_02312 [Debaryomyces fabryi]KSA01940.1 hypothetical protein AC631_02312 [Debaryomyces fabryi]CUM48497.1 unnamed protein product [Debaryomyces fabryi]
MTSKIVVLSYNPENLSEGLKASLSLMNGTSEIGFSVDNSTLDVTHFPSSRIVKLQYSNGRGESFDGSDCLLLLSPSKSFQLHPSRSATPPTLTGSQEVATISNLQDFNEDSHKKYKKKSRNNSDPYTSIYRPFEDLERKAREGRSTKSKDRLKSQSQLKNGKLLSNPHRNSLNGKDHKSPRNTPAPIKTHKQAIDGMVHYKKIIKTSDISLQELEDDWLLNMRTVAERLHFLKEAYKAVQLTKKNKTQGKSDPNVKLHLNSSVVDSSLYLEEDHPSSSQSQPQLLQNDDEDSGSNSNSNSYTFLTASNPI